MRVRMSVMVGGGVFAGGGYSDGEVLGWLVGRAAGQWVDGCVAVAAL